VSKASAYIIADKQNVGTRSRQTSAGKLPSGTRTVYLDESKNPGVGWGLNVPAEVLFEKLFLRRMLTLRNKSRSSNRNATGSLSYTIVTPGYTYSEFCTFRRIRQETIWCTGLTLDRLAPPPSVSRDQSCLLNSTILNDALSICLRRDKLEESYIPVAHLSRIQWHGLSLTIPGL
jgi:hypothetical protein